MLHSDFTDSGTFLEEPSNLLLQIWFFLGIFYNYLIKWDLNFNKRSYVVHTTLKIAFDACIWSYQKSYQIWNYKNIYKWPLVRKIVYPEHVI